jgi:hypothetical protein
MKDSQKPLTPRGRLFFGLCCVAMGIAPLLATFDIGPLGTADINGPPWLGFAAGGVFVVAGLAVIVGPGKPVHSGLLALAALAGLAALGNWIAFGAGARACSGSILFWTDHGMAGLGCRIPFGIGAVITNAIVLLWGIVSLQQVLGGPPKLAGLRRLAESLLLLTLAPILLPMLLFLFGRIAVDVLRSRLRTGKWPRNERFIAETQARKKSTGKSER